MRGFGDHVRGFGDHDAAASPGSEHHNSRRWISRPSLRHSFGTVMAKRVPLPVLRDLMGHSDVQTTLRYIDVGEDQKRDAIAAVFGRGSHVAANESGSEQRSLGT